MAAKPGRATPPPEDDSDDDLPTLEPLEEPSELAEPEEIEELDEMLAAPPAKRPAPAPAKPAAKAPPAPSPQPAPAKPAPSKPVPAAAPQPIPLPAAPAAPDALPKPVPIEQFAGQQQHVKDLDELAAMLEGKNLDDDDNDDLAEPFEEAKPAAKPIIQAAAPTSVTEVETAEDEDEAEEEDEAKAGGAPSQEAYVTVIDGEGNETVFALDRVAVTFGRDEANTVCIADKKASRKHFVIEAAGDYFNALDLGSTNKIRIRGHKLTKRRLRDGDEIVVGSFRIVYRGPTDESEPDELDALPAAAPSGSRAPAVPAAPPPEPPAEAAEPEDSEEDEAPEPAVRGGKARRERPRRRAAGEDAEAESHAAQEPEPDEQTCPECQAEMGEDLVCAGCGYKALKLRAMEHFVDHIARGESLLGGLGLWGLKRKKILAQCFEMPKVKWILHVACPKCGERYSEINEFRVKCINCEECGAEVKLPVHQPPKVG
ncbi:MAG: hypothetical protein AMXMBFR7_50260 [Planctomycetota bacterium]